VVKEEEEKVTEDVKVPNITDVTVEVLEKECAEEQPDARTWAYSKYV